MSLFTELSEIFTKIPFNLMLGLKLDSIESDHIKMNFSMKNELIGNFFQEILHGGVISSVLDMTGGVAAIIDSIKQHKGKSLDELKIILSKTSTIDLHVNYLRPGKGEKFISKGHVVRSGNKICFTHLELLNEENVLIATGSGTYLVG